MTGSSLELCPICFKSNEKKSSVEGEGLGRRKKGRLLQQRRFLYLLHRYLHNGTGGGGGGEKGLHLPLEEDFQKIRIGLVACAKCCELMDSFCQLYHQLEIIRLKLNWKLERLVGEMKGGEGQEDGASPHIRRILKEGDSQNNFVEDDLLDSVIKSRKALIVRCSDKIRCYLPKVSVKKWNSTNLKMEMSEDLGARQDTEDMALASEDFQLESVPDEEEEGPQEVEGGANKPVPSQIDDNDNNDEPLSDEDVPEEGPTDQWSPSSSSSSSFSDSEITPKIEVDLLPNKSTAKRRRCRKKVGNGKKRKLSKVIIGKQPSPSNFRLKCPDCKSLFKDTKFLLLHRKNRKSCGGRGGTSDKSDAIRVEVFTLPDTDNKNLDWAEDIDFTELLAVILVPPEIFLCKICDMALYSPEDLRDHQKLHGTFKCHLCPVTFAYAPDLARHELEHEYNAKKREEYRQKNTKSDWTWKMMDFCARCPFRGVRSAYVKHHLKCHLSLKFNEPKCAICKTIPLAYSSPKRILEHFKDCHDIRNNLLEESNEQLKRCPKPNCKAYFLKESQLRSHLQCHHQLKLRFQPCITSTSTKGSTTVLKCPDCSDWFEGVRKFLEHRRDSEICRGSGTTEDGNGNSVIVEVIWRKTPKSEETVTLTVEIPEEIYICELCNIPLYSKEDFDDHSKLHGKFKCNFCEFEDSYAPNLATHEFDCHQGNNEQKRKRVKRSDGRQRHLSKFCPRCNLELSQFHSRVDKHLQHHLTEHLNLKLNLPQCPICKTTKPGKFDIGKHFKSHHDLSNVMVPEDKVKCEVGNCGAYFVHSWSANSMLKDHLHFRHGSGNLSRKEEEPEESRTQVPAPTTTGERGKVTGFSCRDCDKVFTTLNGLKIHRLRNHIPPENFIPCRFPKCSKVFETKMEMERHFSISKKFHKSLEDPEGNSTRIPCPVCGKLIKNQQNNLKGHMKIHQEGYQKRTYVCDICGKSFPEKCNLRQHLFHHSGGDKSEELYKLECGECGRKFMMKQKLDQHVRAQHTKEKPFVCDICGEAYFSKQSLVRHIKLKHCEGGGGPIKEMASRTTVTRKKKKGRKVASSDLDSDSD